MWSRARTRGAGRVVLVLLLALAAGQAAAQDASRPDEGSGWIVGGSVGLIGFGSQTLPIELSTVGLHVTQVNRGSIGADFSIGTIPRLFAEGAFALGTRLGVTTPLQLAPGVLLLPSAGLTLIAGAGGGGAGALYGYNLGGATVLGTGNVGLRAGVTWHLMSEAQEGIWLFEVGISQIPGRGAR